MPDDAKFLLDVVLSVKSSSLNTSDRTDETPSGTEQGRGDLEGRLGALVLREAYAT